MTSHRIYILGAALLALTALAGCSSSVAANGHEAAPATPMVSTPPTITHVTSPARLGRTATSTDIANAIGCTSPHPYVAPTDEPPPPGPAATGETLCTFGAHTIDIATYRNQADFTAVVQLDKAMLTEYGVETYALVGEDWMVAVNDNNVNIPAEQQLPEIQAIKAYVGGTIVHWGA